MPPKENFHLANAKSFCLGMFFKGKLFKEKSVCFLCGVIENDSGVPLISLGLWGPTEKSELHPRLNEGEGLFLGHLSCEVVFWK